MWLEKQVLTEERPNLWRTFMRVWAQTLTTYAKEQDLKYSREWRLCSFFYAFEISEGGRKEDYMEVGESKVVIGLPDG